MFQLPSTITINLQDPRYVAFLEDWNECQVFTLDIETGYDVRVYPSNMTEKETKVAQKDGLNPFRGKIRLIQVKVKDKPLVLVVDLMNDDYEPFIELLREKMLTKRVIGHNIAFDLAFLQSHFGIICKHPRCTKTMSLMLTAGIKFEDIGGKIERFSNALGSVVRRYLGVTIDKSLQKSNFSLDLTPEQIQYAVNDVVYTECVFVAMMQRLVQADMIPTINGERPRYSPLEIAAIECDVIPAFVHMTLTGQPVDLKLAQELIERYQNAIDTIFEPVSTTLGIKLTASTIALKKVFTEFGIKLDDSKSSSLLAYRGVHYELLHRLSICRSLKKQVDALKQIRLSALNHNGFCKGFYTALGSTGSGRSTCTGTGKTSLESTNLQNIPNSLIHPLVEAFNLPSIRSVIRNSEENSMFLFDLSASHLRLAASNTGDTALVDILSLKDPHAYLTSLMFKLTGDDSKDINYCIANKSTDKQVAKFRQVAKTALYTQFNGGNAYVFYESMVKDYIDVDIETCKLAEKALKEAFSTYTEAVDKMFWQAQSVAKVKSVGEYVKFRTLDGRIFHTEVRKSKKERSNFQYSKSGDLTSCLLISPEAIVMKKSLIDIYNYLIESNDIGTINLNSFTHDDISGTDKTEDKSFTKFCYKVIAKHSTEMLKVEGDFAPKGMKTVDSGLDPECRVSYKKGIITDYSQK